MCTRICLQAEYKLYRYSTGALYFGSVDVGRFPKAAEVYDLSLGGKFLASIFFLTMISPSIRIGLSEIQVHFNISVTI